MKVLKDHNHQKKPKNLKSSRLIVRNLPFKCNEQSVKDYFSKFGEIVDVKLLKKGNKLVGCGFVQYENKLNAAKAISKLSGNEFMGRPIIVDWALPKDKFNKLTKTDGVSPEQSETVIKGENPESDLANNPVTPHSEERNYIHKEPEVDSGTDDSEGGTDEDDESDLDESDEESVKDENDVKPKYDIKKENCKTFSKILSVSNLEKKHRFRYDPNDVADGRTVFIKGIPFSVKDDDLKKCAENIGTVIYAVICVDPLTEHSKGTGFVKYKEKSIVDSLINGKLTLTINGSKLEPYLALKKNQIEDMKERKCPKDNRNLYLVREGVILAGSPAAEGVSEGDMQKRLQLEHWKTQTLRNLNKFVSRTRLVVHNLPPFVDDHKLRQIFERYSPKGSIIREVKVMRNLNDINEKGIGKSKGFGFVGFTKHEHALEALRAINNNPQIFKDSRRPIVGFSIESMVALKLKEKRKEKSRNLGNKLPKSLNSNEKFKGVQKKNKTNGSTSENLPTFSGNVAKPGVKKLRTRKELNAQAQLLNKVAVERKQSKKKFHFSKKLKSKIKGLRGTKK